MSQHRSLKGAILRKKHRSVLKRFERIKELIGKDKWGKGDSVFSLPKVKVVYMKTKKVKAKTEDVTEKEKPEEAKEVKEEVKEEVKKKKKAESK